MNRPSLSHRYPSPRVSRNDLKLNEIYILRGKSEIVGIDGSLRGLKDIDPVNCQSEGGLRQHAVLLLRSRIPLVNLCDRFSPKRYKRSEVPLFRNILIQRCCTPKISSFSPLFWPLQLIQKSNACQLLPFQLLEVFKTLSRYRMPRSPIHNLQLFLM